MLALLRLAPFAIVLFVCSVILLRFPFIGLLTMVALIPGEELTSFIAGRTFVWVLGVATCGSWLLQTLLYQKKVRIAVKPMVLATLWLFWGMVSILWASDQISAYSRAFTLAQAIIFFFLLQNLITDNKRFRIVILTYFVASIIYSIYSIGIEIFTGVTRVSLSEMQNPAHFAQSLGIGLLFTPYILNWSKKFYWKLLVVLGDSCLILAILMTGTRAVWVGLAMGVVFVWLITRGKAVRIRSLVIIGVVLVISISVMSHYGIISDYIIQRIVTLPNLEATHGGAGRTNIWLVGWEMLKNNPIIGVGLNNFPVRFEDYISAARLRGAYAIYPGRDPHNIFLSVQGELGIVGLAVFVAFFIAIFKALFRYRKDPRSILGMLLISFLIISGLAITIQYRKYFWLGMGLATLIPMVIRNEKS